MPQARGITEDRRGQIRDHHVHARLERGADLVGDLLGVGDVDLGGQRDDNRHRRCHLIGHGLAVLRLRVVHRGFFKEPTLDHPTVTADPKLARRISGPRL
jgi:hypothetical protein